MILLLAAAKLTTAETISGLLVLFFGAIGGGAGMVAFYRMKLGEATMDLLKLNNDALESRVTELGREHADCEARDAAKGEQIAGLRGQISTIERLITGHEAIDNAADKLAQLTATQHKEIMEALSQIGGRRSADPPAHRA